VTGTRHGPDHPAPVLDWKPLGPDADPGSRARGSWRRGTQRLGPLDGSNAS